MREYKYLNKINSVSDLKALNSASLPELASEIRQELIDVVSENGGHLAPNLGTVELSIALHRVFNSPKDKIVWDVGHQAYVHKILTGRREYFRTLRQDEGCGGFLARTESEHDAFGAGHAGTAISAALGIAAARDRRGSNEKVLAVIGDGSLNCGISLEGLNNIAETTKNFIIILNDNKMSISKNVGAIPEYLNRIISGKRYNRLKSVTRKLVNKLPFGRSVSKRISKLEESTKSLFVPGVLFEELGIRYIGPVDGHNINALEKMLNGITEFESPVILHVITEKGHGYRLAENSPEKFHGLSAFEKNTGKTAVKGNGITFSKVFGETACKLAEKDEKILAVTAAMSSGTGLDNFAQKYPERFYDVGIAEEHALLFSAGLAAEGYKPLTAVYATFLQRGLDNILHDIGLQKLPVIICADRSGIVDDGPTHHGIHNIPFLLNVPYLSILYPKDEAELEAMLEKSVRLESPVYIGYPRGGSGKKPEISESIEPVEWGKAELVQDGEDLAVFALGREVYSALKLADLIKNELKKSVSVINIRFLKPFDEKILKNFACKMPIVSIEDSQKHGGLAGLIDEILIKEKNCGVIHFGWDDRIVPHGSSEGIRKRMNMDTESIFKKIQSEFFA